MPEAPVATETIQTQPTTSEAPDASAKAPVTAGAEAEAPATEEAKEAPKELVSEKYAKASAEWKKARTARKEADQIAAQARQMQAEARKVLEWKESIKTRKLRGMALLKEFDLAAEDHLSDVLVEGQPDPVRDAAEEAKRARAENAELRKRIEEREQREKHDFEQRDLRGRIVTCASEIAKSADAFPMTAKMFSEGEIQEALFKVHRQAEEEGVRLTFEQAGKVVEHHAKQAYEMWKQRLSKIGEGADAPSQPSSGQTQRPVKTLTNELAAQAATVGRPVESREERKRKLIAELEAARAAVKR